MVSSRDVEARLAVWGHWSERAWDWWDDSGRGRFETLTAARLRYSMERVA